MAFTPAQLAFCIPQMQTLIKNMTDPVMRHILQIGLDEAHMHTINHPHPNKSNHKTVNLKHPYGCSIPIDEKIAPLISELWKAGIETQNSCQDNVPAEYIWIEFYNLSSYQMFLGTINRSKLKTASELAENIAGYGEHNWRITTCIHDDKENLDEDKDEIIPSDTPDFRTTIGVRFHNNDLEAIYQIFLACCQEHVGPLDNLANNFTTSDIIVCHEK